MDRIRDGYHHYDDRNAGTGGTKHHSQPARDPHGRVDGEHEHGDDRGRAGNRAQKKGREDHDDNEHDWRPRPEVIRRGLRERAVHGNIARHVVVDAGMTGASLFQKRVEIPVDLGHRRVLILGESEMDHHPGRPAVTGDQTPDELHGVQGDRLDADQISIGQGARILDQRGDHQVILTERLAVNVVGEGVDPARIGRTPTPPRSAPRWRRALPR